MANIVRDIRHVLYARPGFLTPVTMYRTQWRYAYKSAYRMAYNSDYRYRVYKVGEGEWKAEPYL